MRILFTICMMVLISCGSSEKKEAKNTHQNKSHPEHCGGMVVIPDDPYISNHNERRLWEQFTERVYARNALWTSFPLNWYYVADTREKYHLPWNEKDDINIAILRCSDQEFVGFSGCLFFDQPSIQSTLHQDASSACDAETECLYQLYLSHIFTAANHGSCYGIVERQSFLSPEKSDMIYNAMCITKLNSLDVIHHDGKVRFDFKNRVPCLNIPK